MSDDPDTSATASPEERHSRLGRRVLGVLIFLGLLALGFFASWWLEGRRIVHPGLSLLLALVALYCLAQLLASWGIYLAASYRMEDPPQPAGELSVDVYVTACREPLWMVERALAAAVALRGAHATYLLDDGSNPQLEKMARKLGAGYLTREGNLDRKAGNLNAALPRTSGEVVVIFDIDHVPTPDFLERTLGYFDDPDVGFVQVMLTFSNGDESWVARAACDSFSDFYNPTSLGADRLGGATLVGTNALIRREALESIGGYRPGLAEDLATSIELHAAAWRSVYVAEPLAPGLVPVDVPAWLTQQLKWSRGVFELLLTALPRLFLRLSWGQRLSYVVRMTYYWVGLVVMVHLGFLIAVLFGGSSVARVDFQDYLLHALPLGLVVLAIRQVAIVFWRHPTTRAVMLWRPMLLVPATWPVYTLAWGMALLRLGLGFRATPKLGSRGGLPLWLLPQALTSIALVAGLVFAALGTNGCPPALALFAAMHLASMGTLLWQGIVPRAEPETF